MSDKLYKIQDFRPIAASELLEKTQDLMADGYRLGQMCCTKVEEGLELIYSFDKEHVLLNLKITLPGAVEITSITSVCWPAFIYENEVRDLFGVTFKHSALDYDGKFFKVSEPTPWNPKN